MRPICNNIAFLFLILSINAQHVKHTGNKGFRNGGRCSLFQQCLQPTVRTFLARAASLLRSVVDDWKSGQPYQHVPVGQNASTFIDKSRQMLNAYDTAKLTSWKEAINNLILVVRVRPHIIFLHLTCCQATLLASVAAAFAVESAKDLHEDPQVTVALFIGQLIQNFNGTFPETTLKPFSPSADNRATNILFFFSMACSLTTVTLGLLSLQCIAEYSRGTTHLPFQQFLVIRRLREQSFNAYHIETMISLLPMILQLSLLTFFTAVACKLFSEDHVVAIFIVTVSAIPLIVVAGTRLLPALSPLPPSSTEPTWPAPFRSTASWWFLKMALGLFSAGGNKVASELRKKKDWTGYDKVWMNIAMHATQQYLTPLLKAFNGGIDEAIAIYNAFLEADLETSHRSLGAALDVLDKPIPLPVTLPSDPADHEFNRDVVMWCTIQFLQECSTTVSSDARFAAHKIELYLRMANSQAESSAESRLAKSFEDLFPVFPTISPFSCHPPIKSMTLDDLRRASLGAGRSFSHSFLYLIHISAEPRQRLLNHVRNPRVLKKLVDEYVVTDPNRQGLHIFWEAVLSALIDTSASTVTARQIVVQIFQDAVCPVLKDHGTRRERAYRLVHAAERSFFPFLLQFEHSAIQILVDNDCFKHCVGEMSLEVEKAPPGEHFLSTLSFLRTQRDPPASAWVRSRRCNV